MSTTLDREALLEGQAQVLESIAAGATLAESLTMLLSLVESHAPGVLAAVMLLDADGARLRQAAAPSLPADYLTALDGLVIGERAGSCGAAALRRSPVVVVDIENDPLWDTYRVLARSNGLRACWSTPIFGPEAHLLGTLAMYQRSPAEPTAAHRALVEMAARLAAIAISRRRDEDLLFRSHGRIRQLIEGATDGIIVIDAARQVVAANSSFASMLGYSGSEVLRLHPWDWDLTFPTRERLLEVWPELPSDPHSFESRFRRKDGTEFDAEVSLNPGGGHQGQRQMLVICRDITARKRAEAAHRADQERYQRQREALIALTEASTDSSESTERSLRRICEANARTLDVARVSIWEYTAGRTAIRCLERYDALTRRYERGAVLHAHQWPAYFRALATGGLVAADEAERDPRTAEFTDASLRPRGITAMLDAPVYTHGAVSGVICHEHVGSPRRWTPDEKTFAVAVANLVSLAFESGERRRAQRELEEARDRLQQAVEAGQVGLWQWDIAAHTVTYSPEWKRQIGYDPDEIPDTFEEWRTRVHPDDLDRVLTALNDYLAGQGAAYEVDFRFRHKDGSYRHILTRAVRTVGADGVATRMVGTHLDITDRLDMESRIRQSEKMETVGRLAGGIAHDFNNLLTVINSTAELVLETMGDDAALSADLRHIREAGLRAAGLTHQLLAFSRRQILRPTVVNLGVIVSGMREMLQRLIGETIRLEVVIPDGLGCVRADPGQIEQVVMNLAVNARDAMPDGGRLCIELANVDVDATRGTGHPTAEPGPQVTLALSDSGAGMDAATRERIFEPFFTTKAAGRGTGLGLATVYGIVQQSAGSIAVESEVGRGTTFRIYFPRVEPVVHRSPVGRPGVAARGTETILVVEDEDGVRSLAQRILRSAGYSVHVAADALQARALLESATGPLDLLLTDVVLPGESGRELADGLIAARPGLRVLYTSGYTDDAILRHGVREAAANFIAKPYSPAELMQKVREVLDA